MTQTIRPAERIRLDAGAYGKHWNTPSNIEIDALGRTLRTVERNGLGQENLFITRSRYDIQGNLLTVTDPLDREAFHYTYDLGPLTPWKIDSIDAGIRRMALDARGQEVERRDGKGSDYPAGL